MPSRNDANHGTGPRVTGTIARVTDRGFGFAIVGEPGEPGREYFIHFSNCAPGAWDEICAKVEGKKDGKIRVTFETAQTAKGLRGLNVQLAE